MSICRKFNSTELILDILDTFAIFLLPLVKKTSTVWVHKVTVHDLVPNFPCILQFLLVGRNNV